MNQDGVRKRNLPKLHTQPTAYLTSQAAQPPTELTAKSHMALFSTGLAQQCQPSPKKLLAAVFKNRTNLCS